MKKHYDDFYAEYFKYKKIFKIIWRKIFWSAIYNDIWQYIKKCEICQKTKILRWRFYSFLTALLQFIIFFRKIFLNFIVKLFFNTLNRQVYNLILIVINCCIWTSLYIPITEIITTSVLIELLRRRVFDCFSYPDKVISDQESLFISYYYSQLCYWA